MTYDEILSLAFGEVGLLPSDFYIMSWREFFLKLRGHTNKEYKKWEHTRFIGHSVYANHPNRKKMPSITKFLPLPTDKLNSPDSNHMREVWKLVKEKKNGSKS